MASRLLYTATNGMYSTTSGQCFRTPQAHTLSIGSHRYFSRQRVHLSVCLRVLDVFEHIESMLLLLCVARHLSLFEPSYKVYFCSTFSKYSYAMLFTF